MKELCIFSYTIFSVKYAFFRTLFFRFNMIIIIISDNVSKSVLNFKAHRVFMTYILNFKHYLDVHHARIMHESILRQLHMKPLKEALL
jgi:hypothetical protein